MAIITIMIVILHVIVNAEDIAVTMPKFSSIWQETLKFLNSQKKHQISLEAADQIKAAFDQASAEGLKAFERIGLNGADIKAISYRKLPESKSIAKMAEKLDMSQAQARDLLKEVVADFSAQASDVESTYWKSCMAKGKWKTPQNSSCSQTFWSGCAPATGATLCI